MAANQFARGVDDRLPAGCLVGHLPTLDLGAAAPVGGGCRPGSVEPHKDRRGNLFEPRWAW